MTSYQRSHRADPESINVSLPIEIKVQATTYVGPNDRETRWRFWLYLAGRTIDQSREGAFKTETEARKAARRSAREFGQRCRDRGRC